MKKRLLALLLCLLMVTALLPAIASADDESTPEPQGRIEESLDEAEFPFTNEELLNAQIETIFYGGSETLDAKVRALPGSFPELNAAERAIEANLKEQIREITTGSRTNTEFEVYLPSLGYSTGDVENSKNIIIALVRDCTAELYWFARHWYTQWGGGSFIFGLYVATDYMGSGDFEVDTSAIRSAEKAKANANAIVQKNAALSDLNKLKAYRDAICDLVDYNYDAVYYGYDGENPWQLVWVFDKDPDTKVVCEGYAKAFQYLCDLSAFQSAYINAYCVSGSVSFNGGGGGAHMWNILKMDDNRNYVVDVTNCDGGWGDSYFLMYARSGSVQDGYYLNPTGDYYPYDSETTIACSNADLTLSTQPYSGPIAPPDPVEQFGKIEWNKADVEFKGTVPYVIANGQAQTPRFTVKDNDGNVINPAYYDYQFCENTLPGTGYLFVTFKNGYTGGCMGFFKIYLPASEWLTVENVEEGIKLEWAPVEGAAGYVIYRRAWSSTTNGWTTFERWWNVPETTWTDGTILGHKVYAGTRYQYGVKAYFALRFDPYQGDEGAYIGGNENAPLGNYNLGIVSPLKTTVRITTRKLNSVTGGDKKLTVRWSASKNFTGYEVQIATNAAFTKNVKTTVIDNWKTSETVFKGLTNGKTYYAHVRSYHIFEGMTYYGQWSNVLSVKIGSGQTVEPSETTYRALLIGQNAYQDSPLYGCINDATAIEGALKGLSNSFKTTLIKDATKTQILNGIKTAFADATEDDVSLFHYSGHGVYAGNNTSSSSFQKMQGALCTIDDQYITLAELASALSEVKGRVIVILDSCHSGAAIGRSTENDLDRFNADAIEAFISVMQAEGEGAEWQDFVQSKFIVITAASYSESSWDGQFDGSGYDQGAFSAAFVKGLGCKYPKGAYTGSIPADSNGDKNLTLKEIYDFVSQQAQQWTGSQHAQYYGPDNEVLFKR